VCEKIRVPQEQRVRKHYSRAFSFAVFSRTNSIKGIQSFRNYQIKKCHILFITSSEEANLAKILSSIKGLPSLTVSDMEGFVQRGGIVRLFTAGNKIRFEVNPQAAKRSFLKISSKLLKLAKIFEEDPAKKGN